MIDGTLQHASRLFETGSGSFGATGTAANALPVPRSAAPGGIVLLQRRVAHINTAEANATGFFGGGLKLVAVAGNPRQDQCRAARRTLAGIAPGRFTAAAPSRYSLNQATDLRRGLQARRDPCYCRGGESAWPQAPYGRGALCTRWLGSCSPAEPTWRCGIDIMSFGATKNACAMIVVFAHDIAMSLPCSCAAPPGLVQNALASAQLIAYVENGLWLELARASNRIAG